MSTTWRQPPKERFLCFLAAVYVTESKYLPQYVCWIDATQRVQEDMLYCILKTLVLRIDFSQLSFGKKQLFASVSKEKLWTGDFNDIFLLDGGISFFSRMHTQ